LAAYTEKAEKNTPSYVIGRIMGTGNRILEQKFGSDKIYLFVLLRIGLFTVNE
jgi:hypothetical protein